MGRSPSNEREFWIGYRSPQISSPDLGLLESHERIPEAAPARPLQVWVSGLQLLKFNITVSSQKTNTEFWGGSGSGVSTLPLSTLASTSSVGSGLLLKQGGDSDRDHRWRRDESLSW